MGRAWPEPGEPLFTDEDVEEILDYLALEDEICDGCGLPKVETFNPMNEFAYEALALECHACAAKARKAKQMSEIGGVFMVVERRGAHGGRH